MVSSVVGMLCMIPFSEKVWGPVDLKTVTITAESNNASYHALSDIDLHIRPINSAQDLMGLVPGLFLGQHHGGGIAEHIFLCGFDADSSPRFVARDFQIFNFLFPNP